MSIPLLEVLMVLAPSLKVFMILESFSKLDNRNPPLPSSIILRHFSDLKIQFDKINGNCSTLNLAQTPAELCQMYSCSGEHYNPSSYYYPTTTLTLSTRAITIFCLKSSIVPVHTQLCFGL